MINEAVAFFRGEQGFSRLFALLIEKYCSLGRLGGSVTLQQLSPEEQQSLTTFLHDDYYDKAVANISWTKVAKGLAKTKYGEIALLELLQAYRGQNLLTKQEASKLSQQEKTLFFERLLVLHPQDICQRWLRGIISRHEGTRSVHLAYERDKESLYMCLEWVLAALENLPETYERLPVFAQRVSGNPHCFDQGTEAYRLLMGALQYIRHNIKLDHTSNFSTVEEENQLLYEFHLLRDDLLNFVTCTGIVAMKDHRPVAYWQKACQVNSVLNVPLRELVKVERLVPFAYPRYGQKVFIVENSGVFSAILDYFEQNHLSTPPLLCLHGQFKLASWAAVERLTTAGVILYYSGDFDPEGLQMAQRLAKRYPESVRLWRYTVEDYQNSISTVQLEEQRLGKLSTIVCEELMPVVQAIAVAGYAGYQESLVTAMIQDIVSWQDKDCDLSNKVSRNYFY